MADFAPDRAYRVPPPPPPATATGNGAAARAALSGPDIAGVLRLLTVLPELEDRLAELIAGADAAPDDANLRHLLQNTAELLNEQRSRLLAQTGEVQRLLQLVTSRLDEMTQHFADEQADQKAAKDSGEALNARVLGEVRELTTSAQKAGSLDALRGQVRTRLEAIGSHLVEFRAREQARTRTYEERANGMRSRIDELEREALVLQESLAKEHQIASTDALTGIPNRMAYEDRIEQERRRWEQHGDALCIAVWDIDRFKAINDAYGHQAGDKLIRAVGQYFAKQMREADFVARYGGEEFVTVFTKTPLNVAARIADRLRQGITGMGFHCRGAPVPVTISCGVAAFRRQDDCEAVFGRADKALYEAKNNGRNCVIMG